MCDLFFSLAIIATDVTVGVERNHYCSKKLNYIDSN